jgi:hypothetical protein
MAIGLSAQKRIAEPQEVKKSRRVSYCDDVFTTSTTKLVNIKNKTCTSPSCNSPNANQNQSYNKNSIISQSNFMSGSLLEVGGRRMSKKRQKEQDTTDL